MDTTTCQSYKLDVGGSEAFLKITSNPYNIPIENLFSLAIRDNPKRRFLFVSKVLGKHIPVHPFSSLSCGKLMGLKFAKELYKTFIDSQIETSLVKSISGELEEYSKVNSFSAALPVPHIFIGFAETATALGHSVFSAFSNNCYFIHTTRENILNIDPLLNFDEEHSHAVLHKLFPLNKEIFMSSSPIVLVDDEITTGKSSLNLIESLHKIHPHESYTILSILDWRSKEHKELFSLYETKLNTKINVVSLISGEIEFVYNESNIGNSFVNTETFNNPNKVKNNININKVYFNNFEKLKQTSDNVPYITYTGRFGLTTKDFENNSKTVESCGMVLKEMRTSQKTLCLGTGEFMYLPMLISSFMGEGIYYHSTTRSPIFSNEKEAGYAISNAYHFKDFYDNTTDYYLYNIPVDAYDEAFIFFERDIENNQLQNIELLFSNTSIKKINVVIFSYEN